MRNAYENFVILTNYQTVVNVFRIRIQEDFGSFFRDFEKGVFNVGFIGAIFGFSCGLSLVCDGVIRILTSHGVVIALSSVYRRGLSVRVLTVSGSYRMISGANMDDMLWYT